MRTSEMKKIIKSKRGISVIEAVIAMVVIVIVSTAAVGLINQFILTEQSIQYKTEARVTAQNSLECFKVAESEEEFFGLLKNFESETQRGEGGVYTVTAHEYVATITVNFDTATKTATFTAVVNDNDGKELASVAEYKKLLKAGGGV